MAIEYFTWLIVIFGVGRKLVRDSTGRWMYLLHPNPFAIRCIAGRERAANEGARLLRNLGEIPTRCKKDMRDIH